MKIHKVRLGLATNSSSTHSLIFLPNVEDYAVGAGEFGWQYFVAASEEAKRKYVGYLLANALEETTSDDVAHAVSRVWAETEMTDDVYVDHQSCWVLPYTWDGKSVDKDFFQEVLNFVLQEDLVILGGNDNDLGEHPLSTREAFQLQLPQDAPSKKWVCRKDRTYWTLFNRETGAKVRMSFDPKAPEPTKAKAPELVDIKITDFCPYNCAFCYQNSTQEGAHANIRDVQRLAGILGDLRVFEVAIGGGEPTLHPQFLQVLSTFRFNGVVPNFTTRNLTWLHDPVQRGKILDLAGAFAVSVENAETVKKLIAACTTYGVSLNQVAIQYVMGSTAIFEYKRILEACRNKGLRVTLLGYKTDGRGSEFKPKPYDDWLTVLSDVAKKYGLHVGIDTALATQFEQELKDADVPSWCYEIQEGKFSMYIDAVTKTMARSSYGQDLVKRSIDLKDKGRAKQQLLQTFARF